MVLVSHSSNVPSLTTLQSGLHRILESHSSYLFIPGDHGSTTPICYYTTLLHAYAAFTNRN